MEVEILGHKAKIERISGQCTGLPWHPEEKLVVWLAFDEAVGSTISFAVELPAKKYRNREELLYNIHRRGEAALTHILVRDERQDRERQEVAERQKVLDGLAAGALELLE